MSMQPNMQMKVEAILLKSFQEGSVAVPSLLLKHYRGLNLSEVDVMTLIHFISFIEKERNNFPTLDEIQERMSASPDMVITSVQKLIREQYITIDEETDESTGFRSEQYNLTPLYKKLANRVAEQQLQAIADAQLTQAPSDDRVKNIYTTIENEFARPLTPMELETISNWLDKDMYKEELIMTALKEAVFAGKVHFRYIDRILLDWSRNRVSTVDQAKEYSQRFRQTR
ncbi:DNA replication protein DnaD [Paenibacillus pectinilyticus]|uniref:DNA replication protein DnaD n=1 Tax=Paenibacillus pectinilyticus TaxID=512399 RepID=A0A1C0ZX97_9BACL|nr:DnaD domain protein [Paenibacillus pectinilyticus]OCT12707.1 DNA replication protein DnaD [Paenibacillus pectinilyticus]